MWCDQTFLPQTWGQQCTGGNQRILHSVDHLYSLYERLSSGKMYTVEGSWLSLTRLSKSPVTFSLCTSVVFPKAGTLETQEGSGEDCWTWAQPRETVKMTLVCDPWTGCILCWNRNTPVSFVSFTDNTSLLARRQISKTKQQFSQLNCPSNDLSLQYNIGTG